MDGGPNDILQNVGSMLGGDCKIPCIESNRQLFPQVWLHLEANQNAVSNMGAGRTILGVVKNFCTKEEGALFSYTEWAGRAKLLFMPNWDIFLINVIKRLLF